MRLTYDRLFLLFQRERERDSAPCSSAPWSISLDSKLLFPRISCAAIGTINHRELDSARIVLILLLRLSKTGGKQAEAEIIIFPRPTARPIFEMAEFTRETTILGTFWTGTFHRNFDRIKVIVICPSFTHARLSNFLEFFHRQTFTADSLSGGISHRYVVCFASKRLQSQLNWQATSKSRAAPLSCRNNRSQLNNVWKKKKKEEEEFKTWRNINTKGGFYFPHHETR